MASDHDKPGLHIVPGHVEVHKIGGPGGATQVDRPDIAAKGLDNISQALASGGITIDGPVPFKPPTSASLVDPDGVLDELDFDPDPNDHLPD